MSAFFCAKSLTTAPVEVVQVFVFGVIVYFMTGYQARTCVAPLQLDRQASQPTSAMVR